MQVLKLLFQKSSTHGAVRLSEYGHQTRSFAVTYEFSKDFSTFLIGVVSSALQPANQSVWLLHLEWGGNMTRGCGEGWLESLLHFLLPSRLKAIGPRPGFSGSEAFLFIFFFKER